MTDETTTPEPEQAPAPSVADLTPEQPETTTAETPEPPKPVAENPVPFPSNVGEVEQHHGALAAWFLAHEHALADKVRTAVQTELEALHKYLTALKDRLTSHL